MSGIIKAHRAGSDIQSCPLTRPTSVEQAMSVKDGRELRRVGPVHGHVHKTRPANTRSFRPTSSSSCCFLHLRSYNGSFGQKADRAGTCTPLGQWSQLQKVQPQHFVFGFHGHSVSPDIKTLIQEYYIGSVILMKRNVVGSCVSL